MLTKNALKVLHERFFLEGEDWEKLCRRVAKYVAQKDTEYEETFFSLLYNLNFLPGGRTLANAGTGNNMLANCFVLPIEDTLEGIYETLKKAALIHRSGGGVGYDFSTLRPRGCRTDFAKGESSGPISFLKVYDSSAAVIKQGGSRRSASMGLLRVDHPDIMDFLVCKTEEGKISNFNISVAITDEFMRVLEKDGEITLKHAKSVERKTPAKKIWDRLVEQAWKNGEPGVVFIDKMNKANPTPELGDIVATNPCGEAPLLPKESCNLGAINLTNHVIDSKIDRIKLEESVRVAVRFLDNVIDVCDYPLSEIKEAVLKTRKIGLGVMGFADMLIKMGIVYGSEDSFTVARDVMKVIHSTAWEESEKLGKERGKFIANNKNDRRNATLTTIAPTGTISMIAGVSPGIEPVYSKEFIKKVIDEEGLEEDKYKNVSDEILKTALEIPYEQHIKMQSVFQKYTDNSVSKTANLPNKATKDDVSNAFKLAYKLGCKGITLYRDGSRKEQVYYKKESLIQRPRKRPKRVSGETVEVTTGCGKLLITVNQDKDGICDVFIETGKLGGCPAHSEALGRAISAYCRTGYDPKYIIKQLKGIRCPSCTRRGDVKVLSCPDATASYIEELVKGEQEQEEVEEISCPECGSLLSSSEGCVTCFECGYSECG